MSRYITALFFIIAAVLLTNTAAVEYDYCCDSPSAIPDYTAYGDDIVTVTPPGADDCMNDGSTMDIDLNLMDNMDTDHVYLCIDNSTYTCEVGTWDGFMEADCESNQGNCTLTIADTERVMTTDVVVRFENCAGYSDKPMTLTASFTEKPDINVEMTDASKGQCSSSQLVFDITAGSTNSMNVELNETSGTVTGNTYTFSGLDVDAPYYLHVFAGNCADNDTFHEMYTSPDTPTVEVNASTTSYSMRCDDYDAEITIDPTFTDGSTASPGDFDALYLCYHDMCDVISPINSFVNTISNLLYNETYSPTATLEYCGTNTTANVGELKPSYSPEITYKSMSAVPDGTCMYDEATYTFTITLSEFNDALSDVSGCIDGECKDFTPVTTGSMDFDASFTLNITGEDYTLETNVTNCLGDYNTNSKTFTPAATEYTPQDPMVTYADGVCPTSEQNITVKIQPTAWTGAPATDTYMINVTAGGEQWSFQLTKDENEQFEVPRSAFPLDTVTVDMDICPMADVEPHHKTFNLDPEDPIAIGDITVSQMSSQAQECDDMVRQVQIEFQDKNNLKVDYSYCIRVQGETNCTADGDMEMETDTNNIRIPPASRPELDIGHTYQYEITGQFTNIDCPDDVFDESSEFSVEEPTITTVASISESTKCLSSNETCAPQYTFTVSSTISVEGVDGGAVQSRYCMSDGCGFDDMMDVPAGGTVDTMTFPPNADQETFYLRATSLYCGMNHSNSDIQETTKDSPIYSPTNGDGFSVSLSVDSDSCTLQPSFNEFVGFYDTLDDYYYCFEDATDGAEYCQGDDEWFRVYSSDDMMPNVLNMTTSMRVRAYPARCSGWLQPTTTSQTIAPPASPSFSGDSITRDDVSGTCSSWSVVFSWSSADNTNQYDVCVGDTPITMCSDPITTTSSPSLNVSSADIDGFQPNSTLYVAIQANPDVPCSGTDTISGSIMIPPVPCPSSESSSSQSQSSSGSGSGGNSGSQSGSGSSASSGSASGSGSGNASGSGSGSGSGNNRNDSSDASSMAISFAAVVVAAFVLMNNML